MDYFGYINDAMGNFSRNALANREMEGRELERRIEAERYAQKLAMLKAQQEREDALLRQEAAEKQAKAEQLRQYQEQFRQGPQGRQVTYGGGPMSPAMGGYGAKVNAMVPPTRESAMDWALGFGGTPFADQAMTFADKRYPESKEQDPYKGLTGEYGTFLRATGKQNGPDAYKEWQLQDLTAKKSTAPVVNVSTGDTGFKHERELRNDFLGEPIVKEYDKISQQAARLDGALAEYEANKGKGGTFVAVDQTLINTFNKMLDPESVVREAEYARTATDQSLLNQIKGKWDKIKSGGAGLTTQERNAMVAMARRFNAIAKDKYNKKRSEYSRVATKWQFDPSYVVGENQPKKQTRTGTLNGRKVIEYDDGSVEYAD